MPGRPGAGLERPTVTPPCIGGLGLAGWVIAAPGSNLKITRHSISNVAAAVLAQREGLGTG